MSFCCSFFATSVGLFTVWLARHTLPQNLAWVGKRRPDRHKRKAWSVQLALQVVASACRDPGGKVGGRANYRSTLVAKSVLSISASVAFKLLRSFEFEGGESPIVFEEMMRSRIAAAPAPRNPAAPAQSNLMAFVRLRWRWSADHVRGTQCAMEHDKRRGPSVAELLFRRRRDRMGQYAVAVSSDSNAGCWRVLCYAFEAALIEVSSCLELRQ
jgi:hypothetical protein